MLPVKKQVEKKIRELIRQYNRLKVIKNESNPLPFDRK